MLSVFSHFCQTSDDHVHAPAVYGGHVATVSHDYRRTAVEGGNHGQSLAESLLIHQFVDVADQHVVVSGGEDAAAVGGD